MAEMRGTFFCLVLLLCGFFLHGFFILFFDHFSLCCERAILLHTSHRKKVACLMIMWINWVFLQCPFICLLLHHFSYSAHMFNAFVLLTATTVLSPLNKLNENNEKNAKRVEINQKEWKVMRKISWNIHHSMVKERNKNELAGLI